ncbi:molybdate-binding periplasmic protein precursor [archaeon BMS3Abin16]|nr:molybdate-binding periplasmic protein precursor [archaeon BMS3Abin16]HDY74111.1 molybdate ABC transporter substrate-binding protein [Euryarchaeota archaeon]
MRPLLPVLVATLMLTAACTQQTGTGGAKVEAFSDLYKNGTVIAVCDPTYCPAGRYAEMVISHLELAKPKQGQMLRANIATNDPNVRAVLDKVMAGEVDAGFVYLTDALHENNSVQIIEIPREYAPLPQYGASITRYSENPDSARLFIKYLTSKEGQALLQKYGFTPGIQLPEPFAYGNFSTGAITVFAASSLTESFTDIAAEFENKTGIQVTIGFASSGILRQKIEAGAPADVYATASLRHSEILMEQNLIEEESVFARNHLVVVSQR